MDVGQVLDAADVVAEGVQEGAGLEQPDRLAPAAVGGDQFLAAQGGPQGADGIDDRVRGPTAGTAPGTACWSSDSCTVVRAVTAGAATAERTRPAKWEGSARYPTSSRTSSRSQIAALSSPVGSSLDAVIALIRGQWMGSPPFSGW